MKIAIFQYRCRRCGRIFDGAEISEAHARGRLVEAILNIKIDHKDIPLGLMDTHICNFKPHDDGGMGVGELIGYKIEEQ